MKDLYCTKCLDYTSHEEMVCSVCGETYDPNKRRVVIAGPADDPVVIKAKEKFLSENPELIISEDVALAHRLKDFATEPKEMIKKIEPSPMIRNLEDLKYAHLTRKEREADIQPIRTEPKIQRNEPCPCGSGKKYKKCCGKN